MKVVAAICSTGDGGVVEVDEGRLEVLRSCEGVKVGQRG